MFSLRIHSFPVSEFNQMNYTANERQITKFDWLSDVNCCVIASNCRPFDLFIYQTLKLENGVLSTKFLPDNEDQEPSVASSNKEEGSHGMGR